jgi:Flp pilus assembly protein TadD
MWRAALCFVIVFPLLMPGPGFLAAQQATPTPSPEAAKQAQYDQAIAAYKKALESVGQDSKAAADLHLRLGETYARKGDLNLAIESLQKAKQLAPGNLPITSRLALALDSADRIPEAQKQYEAVLALDPDDVIALNNLAYLLSQYGDLERALKLAYRASELLPGNSEISDTIGWIQLKRNMPDHSIAAFRDSVRGTPSNPRFHYHLGMAFSQKGEKTEAIAELRTALTLDPSPQERDKIRQLLDALQR